MLLAQHGWSQAQLAKRAGLRHRNISSIVAGTREPAVSVGLAIAEALEVSADWLWRDVWGPDHPTPPTGTLGALDTSTIQLECLRRRRFAREALNTTLTELNENLDLLIKKLRTLFADPTSQVRLEQEVLQVMELASAYRSLCDSWEYFDRNLGAPIRANPDELKSRRVEETWLWLTRGYYSIEQVADQASWFLTRLGADASSERMQGIINRLAQIVFERNKLLPEAAPPDEHGTVAPIRQAKGQHPRSDSPNAAKDEPVQPRKIKRRPGGRS